MKGKGKCPICKQPLTKDDYYSEGAVLCETMQACEPCKYFLEFSYGGYWGRVGDLECAWSWKSEDSESEPFYTALKQAQQAYKENQ